MLILITLAAIAVIGAVLFLNDEFSVLGTLGSIVGFISGILLVMAITVLPFNHMGVESKIAEFHEIRATAERMRAGENTWEAAAYQTKVADANQWLRGTQYYNGTVFDIWIPDQVMALDPIR